MVKSVENSFKIFVTILIRIQVHFYFQLYINDCFVDHANIGDLNLSDLMEVCMLKKWKSLTNLTNYCKTENNHTIYTRL